MIDKFLSLLTDSLFILLGFGPDVVTVTSGTAGNAGSTAAELITYMSARLLEVAEFNTILDQFGDKHPLPSNSSKTIRFVREEKLTVAATPTQLTEGIPPDAVGLTLNQIEAQNIPYPRIRLRCLIQHRASLNPTICWKLLRAKDPFLWNRVLDWTISRKDVKQQFA